MRSTNNAVSRNYKIKVFWLYTMVVLYVAAGINHFIKPNIYLSIVPSYLPYHVELVYISGACEILFGLLLIPFLTRKWAALGIILLLIAVFPANVQMMLNYLHTNHPYTWVTILRLPLQIVLIRWAYKYYKRPALKRLAVES
ncbi:DoxX family protein [soil metagenome]